MSTNAENAAIAVAKAFNDAFNAQDHAAQAATMNYPHLRLAGGAFATIRSAAHFLELAKEIKGRLDKENWHHTNNPSIEVLQSGDDKVHLVLHQERCHENGEVYNRFDTLWIVTLQDGHWGVQFRSSYLR